MLQAPIPCGFRLVLDSNSGQPTSANISDTTLTADASMNTKSAWTDIFNGTTLTDDVYAIQVIAGMQPLSADNRKALVDIGVDPANGTSYSVLIPNLLIAPNNSGTSYFFPLFIKAGTKIAARWSWEATTTFNINIRILLFCRPTAPELWRTGTYVEAYGAVTSESSGSPVVSGTTTDGVWSSLGTTTKPVWFWQAGILRDTGTGAAVCAAIDIAEGDGLNFNIILPRLIATNTTGELCSQVGRPTEPCWAQPVGASRTIYARARDQGTSRIWDVVAYGMG